MSETGAFPAIGDLQVKLKYKKGERDDWTKVDDKALRKKIQNRLAKRKSRKSYFFWLRKVIVLKYYRERRQKPKRKRKGPTKDSGNPFTRDES